MLLPFFTTSQAGRDLSEAEIVRLIRARGDDFNAVVQAADELRQQGERRHRLLRGEPQHQLHNICYFKCQFCAFSKGKLAENLRGRPYDLSLDEIQRRTMEAWQRGGTEVCMQGGIHPEYTGATYIEILKAVKRKQCPPCTFTPSRRWRCGRALPPRI